MRGAVFIYKKSHPEYFLYKEFEKLHNVAIYKFTTRKPLIVSKWVVENGLDEYVENVTNVKEPAYLIIDDRCINFDGDYEKRIKLRSLRFGIKSKVVQTK
jgi:hypothetical protein